MGRGQEAGDAGRPPGAYGTSTIFPWWPFSMTASWAREAWPSRQLLLDDRPQGAVPEPFDQGGVDAGQLGRRGVKQRHADDGRVLVHSQSRVEVDGAAVADDRDAPAHGEGAEVLLEIHVCQHLEDDVDALAARELDHLVEVAGRCVVEDVVGAVSATIFRPFSVPAVPMTVSPRARASWTAAMPTPPLAPCTSTDRRPRRGRGGRGVNAVA
jgi:hypothetical protein